MLIVIDNNGYLDLTDAPLTELKQCSAFNLFRGFYLQVRYYDENGIIWKASKISSEYPNNIWTRFLAYTIYNPTIKVDVNWSKESYKLEALKNDIKFQIDKDDDILTQFVEGEIIKQAIDNCVSFEEIIHILNKYIFKVDEEIL